MKAQAPAALRQIHIAPVENGFHVTHAFHAAPSKQFVFHDPAKMRAHVDRAVKTQWLHPNVGRVAGKITKSLNLTA